MPELAEHKLSRYASLRNIFIRPIISISQAGEDLLISSACSVLGNLKNERGCSSNNQDQFVPI